MNGERRNALTGMETGHAGADRANYTSDSYPGTNGKTFAIDSRKTLEPP
jgi:hypothetical protein